jgi:hypothetical protein
MLLEQSLGVSAGPDYQDFRNIEGKLRGTGNTQKIVTDSKCKAP